MVDYNKLVYHFQGKFVELISRNVLTKDGEKTFHNAIFNVQDQIVTVGVREGEMLEFLKTSLKAGDNLSVQGDLRTITKSDGESEFVLNLSDSKNSVVKRISEDYTLDCIIAKGNLEMLGVEEKDGSYKFSMQYYFAGSKGFPESKKHIFDVQVTKKYVELDSSFAKKVSSKEFLLFKNENVPIQMTKNVKLNAKVILDKNLLTVTSTVGWIFEPYKRMENIDE